MSEQNELGGAGGGKAIPDELGGAGGGKAIPDELGGAGGGKAIPDELAQMRGSIDNLDAAVIHIMAERFKITQRVGELKAELGLPASDPGREKIQIGRLRQLAEESHLDPEFAEKLLNFIVSEVVRHHTEIAEQN